jgi:hypothetical protein
VIVHIHIGTSMSNVRMCTNVDDESAIEKVWEIQNFNYEERMRVLQCDVSRYVLRAVTVLS